MDAKQAAKALRPPPPRTDFMGLKFDPGPERANGEKMTKQALEVVMMLVLIVSLAFLTAVVSANA
jgi:peptide subunit release factor 1 (eRF1)